MHTHFSNGRTLSAERSPQSAAGDSLTLSHHSPIGYQQRIYFLFCKLICLGIVLGLCIGWLSTRQAKGGEPGFIPTSVEMWGSVANWDFDPAPDGWAVQLRWLQDGHSMQHAVEPIGRNDWVAHFRWTPIMRDAVGRRVPVDARKEMQWTVRIDPDMMRAKLPFRGNSLNWEECGAGVLAVRVSVPGVGVVENAIIMPDPHPFLVDTDRNYR